MAGDRTLVKVLELRKKAEDEALKKWSDAQRQLTAFISQLDKIKSFRNLYVQEMLEHNAQVTDLQHYLSYQGFIERLDKTYERQMSMLSKLKEQSESLKESYLKSRQQRCIIESLIDKHRMHSLKMEASAEAKISDDLVSSKQARALIESNLEHLNLKQD